MLGTYLFSHPYLHLVLVSTFDWISALLKGSITCTWRCLNLNNSWHTNKECIWVWEGMYSKHYSKIIVEEVVQGLLYKKKNLLIFFLNIRKLPNIKIYTYFHCMWSLWTDNHVRFTVKRKNTYIWCFKISSP